MKYSRMPLQSDKAYEKWPQKWFVSRAFVRPQAVQPVFWSVHGATLEGKKEKEGVDPPSRSTFLNVPTHLQLTLNI